MQNDTIYNNQEKRQFALKGIIVFSLLWILLFLVYWPAAKAGFVADFTGWLEQEKYHSFLENLNRTNYQVHSLYQLTQLVTYIFYKLFGINEWAWHILFVSLHAVNAYLVYSFTSNLLKDTGVSNSKATALAGALLFCVTPYVSETIVWEPAFHFLQGLLLLMLVLMCVQRYIHTGNNKYVWSAGIIYFLSTFSLEVFYITPWLVLLLAFFYQYSKGWSDKRILAKISKFFFLPLLLLFVVRLIVFKVVYGDWVSRIGSGAVTTLHIDSLGKPAKYLFHLLFMGRFFSFATRQKVYALCDGMVGIALFYGIVLVLGIYIIARFRQMAGKGKVASLLFIYMIISLLLLIPLWFQDALLVLNDRYTYFTDAFFYMLVAVLVSFITVKVLRIGLLSIFALVNLRFAIQVNRYWGKSYKIIYSLLHNIPDEQHRTIVLLNLPQSMHGIAMIGAEKNSEYKLMHDLLIPEKALKTTVYDAQAYNMETPEDGAHVNVINDSTLRVTLNQWGTWWWFETKGGYSYENSDYKLNLIDGGHFYEMTLKKPAQQYLLLYQVGDQWKAVDMSKLNADQN